MTTVEANGVTLGVEHFGDAAAPIAGDPAGNAAHLPPDPSLPIFARSGSHWHET